MTQSKGWQSKRQEATIKVKRSLAMVDSWAYLHLMTQSQEARRDIAVMALGAEAWSLDLDTLIRVQVAAELGRISRDEALARIAELRENLGLEVATPMTQQDTRTVQKVKAGRGIEQALRSYRMYCLMRCETCIYEDVCSIGSRSKADRAEDGNG